MTAPIGWVYRAALYLGTPLTTLLHHGDRATRDSIRIEHGRHGQWLPVFAVRHDTTIDSFAGRVAEDGGDVLPWLRRYRATIEDEGMSVRDRVAGVLELVDDPACARFRRMLPADIATGWAASRIAGLTGLSISPAIALVAAGFLDLDSIDRATDAELLDLPGIGRKTVAAVRAAISRRRIGSEPRRRGRERGR